MKAAEIILEYMQEQGISYRELGKKAKFTGMNAWYTINNGTENDLKVAQLINLCKSLDIKLEVVKENDTSADPSTVDIEKYGSIAVSDLSDLLKISGLAIEINSKKI